MLLTRSPLIPPQAEFTVRLACVKHAASVRPEPGSNSQKNDILNSKELKINLLNNLLLAIITQEFSLAVIRFKTLKQSIYCQGVCSSLRYSIYKVQNMLHSRRLPFIAQLSYVITNSLACQEVF